MNKLQILIGLIINRTEKVHDYIQIVFSDDTILSIFNNYHYDDSSILAVEGMAVESVDEGDRKITITLTNGSHLSVGMADNDYNGPEAIVLRREGGTPIVWN